MVFDLNKLANSAQATKVANMQLNHTSRTRVCESGRVLQVTLKPSDGEAVDPKNIKPKHEAGRQRNEVRFKDDSLVLAPAKSGEWRVSLRIDRAAFNVAIDGFYHLIQLKSPDVSRPVFTVGIKRDNVAVYFCDGIKPSCKELFPVSTVLGKWIQVSARVDRAKKMVTWKVETQKGTYSSAKVPVKEIYLKLGQYMSFPNECKADTSASYKNVELVP